MDPDRIDPALRDAVLRGPRPPVRSRAGRALIRLVTRRLMPAARVPGVRIEDVRVGGARFRLYTPAAPSGAGLVWIHGGGMVIGGPRQDDRLCAGLAAELGAVIASVDYRMAPEHPHPVPVQDCLAVWRAVLAGADGYGVDPARIAVGGASAGAGLAAAVVHTVHDERGPQPAAQLLLYPMLDDRTAADRTLDEVEHPVWDNRLNLFGWSSLLRGTASPGDPDVPASASPARREHLEGLPPTWIGVGDLDLFHAEDTAHADRLRAAGVDVTFVEVAGAPHGFDAVAPDAAPSREFLAAARDWLRAATAPR